MGRVARNLSEHLSVLEERGLLRRVSRPVNKDTELHPLVRWQFRGLPEDQRTAFLFERVTGSRNEDYDIPVAVGSLAASQQVYNLALGCETAEDADQKWRRALAQGIPPAVVETGPCQEVVLTGDELEQSGGLGALPIPISTPGFDNAPYFNSGIWITKDPDTGVQNCGIYRAQVKGPLRTGFFPDSNKNAATMWDMSNERGRPLQAAVVIGAAPAIYFAAVQIAPYGQDELEIAGALMGEPVEVVRARTVDLVVPAEAEIVIEGILHTDHLEPEGSFGEAHGYSDPRTLSPVFTVTAITRRARPTFLSILSQLTPSESSKLKQVGYEARALHHLRTNSGLAGVKQVVLYEELMNRQYGVVSMDKRDRFEPLTALYSMLALRASPKMLVAVDSDIDARDPMMVNWAIVNRAQPHRDIRIVHPRPLPFGPLRSASKDGGYDPEDSALLIDATAKAPLPPVALPARPYMERAREIWDELGFPKLTPRPPWYGYSLGLWSADAEDEAALATEGRYFDTGEKLATSPFPMPQGTKLRDIDRHL